jgi:hypothetical protein
MKRKNFISLSLAFIFTVMSVSGVLLYLKQKSHPIEMAHTIFGLMMVGFAIFHIYNNWGSIRTYAKDRNTKRWNKELAVAGISAVIILSLALTSVLEPVAEFGRIFAPKKQGGKSIAFQERSTLETGQGKPATLIIQRKETEMLTPVKIELADSAGKTIALLYEDAKPSEEDLEEKRPLPNAIVQTKINAAAPFRIIVSTEKNKYETVIPSGDAGIYSFGKSELSPLKRGLIEFN